MIRFPFSSAENRLIRRNIDDFGGTRFNRRNAQINAANQAGTHQRKLASNLKSFLQSNLGENSSRIAKSESGQILLGGANAVNDRPLNQEGFQTMNQSVVDGQLVQETTMAPELGRIDQAALDRLMRPQEQGGAGLTEAQARERITSLRPSIQQTTSGEGGLRDGRVVLTPQQAADNAEAAVRARYAALTRGGSSINPENLERDVQMARQNALRQAEVEAFQGQMQQNARDAEMRRQASMDAPTVDTGQSGGSQTTNSVSQSNNTQFQQLQSILNTNPVFAGSAYAPIIQAMMSNQSSVDADEILLQQLSDFQKEDADFSGATDAVEAAAEESKRLLKERAEKQDAINKRHLEIAKETAEIAKEMAEFEKQKFEINQKIREQEQREANIENEQRNRRIANKMGIETDTQGLKFMRDEVRKGKEALQRLSEFGDAQRGQFALQIGRQYSLDINNALLRYDEQQLLIDSNFERSLKEIDNTVSMDAKERRERKDGIWKEYWDRKMEQDKETARTMREMGKEMMDRISETRDDEIKKDNETWDRAMKYLDTFGTKNTEALNEFEKELRLPRGTLSNQKTLEELRMRKATGGAGVAKASVVDQEREMIRSRFPSATVEEIDNLVYISLSTQYSDKDMREFYSYMKTKPLGAGGYTLRPIFDSGDAKETYDSIFTELKDKQDLLDGTLKPIDLYNMILAPEDMTAAQREKSGLMTKEEALGYMESLGHPRTDKFGRPSFDPLIPVPSNPFK